MNTDLDHKHCFFVTKLFSAGPSKVQEAHEDCGGEEGALPGHHEDDDGSDQGSSSRGDRQAKQRGQAPVQVRVGGSVRMSGRVFVV